MNLSGEKKSISVVSVDFDDDDGVDLRPFDARLKQVVSAAAPPRKIGLHLASSEKGAGDGDGDGDGQSRAAAEMDADAKEDGLEPAEGKDDEPMEEASRWKDDRHQYTRFGFVLMECHMMITLN